MEAVIPNFKVLLVQLLTFALGMAVIWKLYIVSLRDHLHARREGIVRDLARADEARREAAALRAQLEDERVRMAEEIKKARQEAREEAARLREQLLAEARGAQEAMLKQGRERLEGESRRAVAEIRAQAAALVVQAAGVLAAKRMDAGADLALAQRLVAAVKASPN